jgi:bifunctional UDP-N-acetylglucosamine pyrophosphorylase/glucosamine-1-phosphate N-acetyltransferase
VLLNKTVAIVPCAGLGTRMKSKTPKFLHKVCGFSIISHIVYALIDTCSEIVLVVGNGADLVKAEIKEQYSNHPNYKNIKFALQEELLGSGDAVRVGLTQVSQSIESIFIIPGDVPLIDKEFVSNVIEYFNNEKADVLLATALLENPFGYGRIVRDDNENIIKIVEEKDCTNEQRKISESNMYPFVVEKNFLLEALPQLNADNAQKEIYLTDIVQIAAGESKKVVSYLLEDYSYVLGINDREQLAHVEKLLRKRINNYHMLNGVTLEDPDNTYIDILVTIEKDVTIGAGSKIKGRTAIGSGCVILDSVIVDSVLEENVRVGPKSYLRPGTILHDNVHVGTSVEIKKSEIGRGTKVPHLSYIGDCITGENCNFGGGTITANYDGKDKHQTILGDNVKLGVNTILVAPVKIGNNVYSAAGAVITKDVPDGALAKGVPAHIVEKWIPPVDRQ